MADFNFEDVAAPGKFDGNHKFIYRPSTGEFVTWGGDDFVTKHHHREAQRLGWVGQDVPPSQRGHSYYDGTWYDDPLCRLSWSPFGTPYKIPPKHLKIIQQHIDAAAGQHIPRMGEMPQPLDGLLGPGYREASFDFEDTTDTAQANTWKYLYHVPTGSFSMWETNGYGMHGAPHHYEKARELGWAGEKPDYSKFVQGHGAVGPEGKVYLTTYNFGQTLHDPLQKATEMAANWVKSRGLSYGGHISKVASDFDYDDAYGQKSLSGAWKYMQHIPTGRTHVWPLQIGGNITQRPSMTFAAPHHFEMVRELGWPEPKNNEPEGHNEYGDWIVGDAWADRDGILKHRAYKFVDSQQHQAEQQALHDQMSEHFRGQGYTVLPHSAYYGKTAANVSEKLDVPTGRIMYHGRKDGPEQVLQHGVAPQPTWRFDYNPEYDDHDPGAATYLATTPEEAAHWAGAGGHVYQVNAEGLPLGVDPFSYNENGNDDNYYTTEHLGPERLTYHGPRDNFRKVGMAADPAFVQQWIQEHGPYLYHGVREGHDPQQILQQGIRPGMRAEQGEAQYGGRDPHSFQDWEMEDWWHTPRPGHTFMVTNPENAYGTNLMRVDLRKLDPANLNPDDDQLRDLGGVPGMGEEGWVYEKDPEHPTLGEQAEALDWGSNPEDTHNAFDAGTVAHRGTIPPEAIEHYATRPDEWQPWQPLGHDKLGAYEDDQAPLYHVTRPQNAEWIPHQGLYHNSDGFVHMWPDKAMAQEWANDHEDEEGPWAMFEVRPPGPVEVDPWAGAARVYRGDIPPEHIRRISAYQDDNGEWQFDDEIDPPPAGEWAPAKERYPQWTKQQPSRPAGQGPPPGTYNWLDRQKPGEIHGLGGDCVNPKCDHQYTDEERHELAQYGEMKCPACGTLQNNIGQLGGAPTDEEYQRAMLHNNPVRAGITLTKMGQIGEAVIKRIGQLPCGPVERDLNAEYGDKAPVDFVCGYPGKEYGVEVKANHSEAQPRFKVSGSAAKRQRMVEFCHVHGYRQGFVGVRLNFYTDKADVFWREGFTDTWYGDTNMQHIGTYDFGDLNPFRQPDGSHHVPAAESVPDQSIEGEDTMRRVAAWDGRPLIHGTDREFQPGEVVAPVSATGASAKYPDNQNYSHDHVYVTTSPSQAQAFGKNLYEVEPLGDVEEDPENAWGPGVNFRVPRARVVGPFVPEWEHVGGHLAASGADHAGAMVALYVPGDTAKELHVEGGEPAKDMHITLAFFAAKADDEPEAYWAGVKDVIEAVAREHAPLHVTVGGLGRFNGEDDDDFQPLIGTIDCVGLVELHMAIKDKLGDEYPLNEDHGFNPHVTLQYIDRDRDDPNIQLPVEFEVDSLTLMVGGERTDFDLTGEDHMSKLAMGLRGDMPENIEFQWNDPMNPTELTAWVAGQKVGIMEIDPHTERIDNIGVPEAWQRRGIATAMFDEAQRVWPGLQHSFNLSQDAQGWVGNHDPDHLEAYQKAQQSWNPFRSTVTDPATYESSAARTARLSPLRVLSPAEYREAGRTPHSASWRDKYQYHRVAVPQAGHHCGSCGAFNKGHCSMFDAKVENDFTCDEWVSEDDWRKQQDDKAADKAISHEASLQTKDYEGEPGDTSHITRVQTGTLPTSAVANMAGARGEQPGEHRNKQGDQWEQFKADVAANGIREPIFITVDPGQEPKISEGNHRRDAAVELGLLEVPVEIRYFGHAQQGTTLSKTAMAQPVNEVKAHYLTEHLERLGEAYGIGISWNTVGEGTAYMGNVSIPVIRTDYDYLIGLHEIGHIAAHQADRGDVKGLKGLGLSNGYQDWEWQEHEPPLHSGEQDLEDEAKCWRWAAAQSHIPVTPDMWQDVLRDAQSYHDAEKADPWYKPEEGVEQYPRTGPQWEWLQGQKTASDEMTEQAMLRRVRPFMKKWVDGPHMGHGLNFDLFERHAPILDRYKPTQPVRVYRTENPHEGPAQYNRHTSWTLDPWAAKGFGGWGNRGMVTMMAHPDQIAASIPHLDRAARKYGWKPFDFLGQSEIVMKPGEYSPEPYDESRRAKTATNDFDFDDAYGEQSKPTLSKWIVDPEGKLTYWNTTRDFAGEVYTPESRWYGIWSSPHHGDMLKKHYPGIQSARFNDPAWSFGQVVHFPDSNTYRVDSAVGADIDPAHRKLVAQRHEQEHPGAMDTGGIYEPTTGREPPQPRIAMPVGPLPDNITYKLLGSPKTYQCLYAQTPEFAERRLNAAYICWYPDGEIKNIYVQPDLQRRGLATELLRRAREINPNVHHSDQLSDDAKGWSQSVSKTAAATTAGRGARLRLELICGRTDAEPDHPGYYQTDGTFDFHPKHDEIASILEPQGIEVGQGGEEVGQGQYASDCAIYFEPSQIPQVVQALDQVGYPADDLTINGQLSPEERQRVEAVAQQRGWPVADRGEGTTARVAAEPTGPVYYHGYGRNYRSLTGIPDWDNAGLFVSHDPAVAKLYGSKVDRIEMAPDTKVMRFEGQPQRAVENLRSVKGKGYDVVEFHNPHDFIGHIILNQDKILRRTPHDEGTTAKTASGVTIRDARPDEQMTDYQGNPYLKANEYEGESIVAEHQGQPVGNFMYLPPIDPGDGIFLDHAWVHPEHRGKGIGRQLFDEMTRRYPNERVEQEVGGGSLMHQITDKYNRERGTTAKTADWHEDEHPRNPKGEFTVKEGQHKVAVYDKKGKLHGWWKRCRHCGVVYAHPAHHEGRLACPTCGEDVDRRLRRVQHVAANQYDNVALAMGWDKGRVASSGHQLYEWQDANGVPHTVAGYGQHGQQRPDNVRNLRRNMNTCMNGKCQHLFSGMPTARPAPEIERVDEPGAYVLKPGTKVSYGGKDWWVMDVDGGLAHIYDAKGQEDIVPQTELRAAGWKLASDVFSSPAERQESQT